MNRTYLVVPVVGMAMFAGYYIYWQAHSPAPPPAESKMADEYAGRDGAREAEAELAAGKLVLIETGPGVAWDRERREIARNQYGVEIRALTGAASSEAFARYVDAFNRVMRPKVIARHGRSFFETLHREAIALMESRRGQDGQGKAAPDSSHPPAAPRP